jgi:hypothetical protein
MAEIVAGYLAAAEREIDVCVLRLTGAFEYGAYIIRTITHVHVRGTCVA